MKKVFFAISLSALLGACNFTPSDNTTTTDSTTTDSIQVETPVDSNVEVIAVPDSVQPAE